MSYFTMDGYTDSEECAERLIEAGFLPGHNTQAARRVVAAVLRDLLDVAKSASAPSVEFYGAACGIVDCAEEDRLL